jgi:hypothetical protein
MGDTMERLPRKWIAACLLLLGVMVVGMGLYLGLAPVGDCGSPWRPRTGPDGVYYFRAPPHSSAGFRESLYGNRGVAGIAALVAGGCMTIAGLVVLLRDRVSARVGDRR